MAATVIDDEVSMRGTPRSPAPASPRRRSYLARALILTVTAAGIAVTARQIPVALHWTGIQLLAAAGLTVATLVAELFPLHLRHRTETETFSVTDVVWTAALILAAPSTLLVAVAAGVLLSQAVRRQPLEKGAFNVGQFVMAMWVAQTLFRVIPHEGALAPATWVAAAAAMSLNFVVNEGLVGLVISVTEREPVRGVVLDSLGLDVLHTAGDIAIGVISAVLWRIAPVGVVVAGVPVLLSYLAYAGWLRSVRERDRMQDLYRAGQVLLDRLETEGDFSDFLRLVSRMMDAQTAEIVTVRDGVTLVYDLSGVVSVVPRPRPSSEPSVPAGFHRPPPGMTVQAAAIAGPEDEVGTLAVFRRTPLSSAERSLLEALAAQVYVKLRHSAVFARSVAREQELARIISSSSDGIFVTAGDGRVRSWSPAMERITGVGAQSAIGRPLWDVLESPVGEDQVWRRFGDPGSVLTGVVETGAFVRADGTIGWVRFSRSGLRSHDGDPSGVVAVARDVSADILAEQSKANFIAAISHELRTPLTPLKGYLSLYASGQLATDADTAKESFEVMLRQADRLEHLINDLLEASQMETGRPVTRTAKVDLVELVGEVGAEEERESGRKIRVESRCRSAWVLADPLRVKQVLAILISNAVKYSPAPSPVGIETEADDHRCVVSVVDRGEGIPEAEQAHVFERFYRSDNGSTRATGGVGLGLYIAKQLVESMGGRLWLSSQQGEGSTFSFSVPLVSGPGQTPPAGSTP
jgi:PAS domain S-box-containing protein